MAVLIESLTKSTDKSIISIGEELTFSFVFESTQSATVEVTFVDNLPPCLQFVPRSVILDGVRLPDANPVQGFTFTHVNQGTNTMSFIARAVCRPDDGIVFNNATASYTFAGVPDIITSNTLQIVITAAAACDVLGQQMANVCLPVSVQPFATVGTIVTRCCGAAIIAPGTVCSGTPNMNCNFTISQRICVEVPVEFGATVTPGEAHVQCTGENCDNCPESAILDAEAKGCGKCKKTANQQ